MQIVFTDGLGNQMFQYALYLALKEKGRTPSINTGIAVRSIVHNGFELCSAFEIDEKALPIVMNNHFTGGLTIFAIRKFSKWLCYHENIDLFSEEVFKTHKLFVCGYWQDYRYFGDVEEQVRLAFAFRNIDNINKQLGDEMEACNSVSIHIRRGDYLKYPNYQVCTPSYYERTIRYMMERIDNPLFYVFSDDMEWSSEMMKKMGVAFKVVNNNRGRESYKDMYLMTCCRHNIIANSSFSWWGAWLNGHKEKIVLCPNVWLKNHEKDIALDNWVKIETE